MAVSSATPCLSEATGGAETHCPEVTRPVGEPHMLCPTIYDRDDGQRQDIVFPSIISGMCSPPRSPMWPKKSESRGIIPSRHYVDSNEGRVLSSDEVYIGFVRTVKEYKGFTRISAHRPQSHRHCPSGGGWGISKWASPFTVGQHGTIKDCLIMYTGYISSCHLAGEIEELRGKRLLSDTPENIPCTADILIALVCHAWRVGSLDRYPIWDLDALHEHVTGADLDAEHQCPGEGITLSPCPHQNEGYQLEQGPLSKQPRDLRSVWRQPRQSSYPIPDMASSSTSHFSSQGIKLEQGKDINQDNEDRYGNIQSSGLAPLVIGSPQPSIFGPCGASSVMKMDGTSKESSYNSESDTGIKMARVFPLDRGGKEATFTALSIDFGFDDKVMGLFLESPMNSLADFRNYFTNENEIAAFVVGEASSEEPEQKLRISRVRQAWTAVRQHGLHSDNCSTTSSVAGLDDLLDETTLRQIKVQFWKRHKSAYPAEVLPSDHLLSRCYNEMEKRLLTVYDIEKVESLLHQVMTTKPRMNPGAYLCTIKESWKRYWRRGQWRWQQLGNNEVDKYLAMLYSYLLALAIAGSGRMQGAPADELPGTDSTKFVKAPWDVLQVYYFRAHRSVMSLPEVSRLAWLKEKDVAERAVWVSQFRGSDESLGRVVQSVMDRMSAHWDVPTQGRCGLSSPFPPSQPPPVPEIERRKQDRQHKHRQSALQVRQKAALASDPRSRKSRTKQQQWRAHRSSTKPNHMDRSNRDRTPITTDVSPAGSQLCTIKLSGGPMMRHPGLCDIFAALLFMDDYVRQALTDRTALLPEIQVQLKYFKHLVESHNDWELEVGIEEDCNRQSARHSTEDRLCLSCGINPGARHLGYDECSSCYDEH